MLPGVRRERSPDGRALTSGGRSTVSAADRCSTRRPRAVVGARSTDRPCEPHGAPGRSWVVAASGERAVRMW